MCEWLREMGLKLNPEKWQLAVKRAAFMGHEKSHTEAGEKTVQPRTFYVRSWDWQTTLEDL